MKVVIPAAGRGTRFGDRTDDCPKHLLDVAGKPILEHVLDATAQFGERIVVVGYEGEQIVDRYRRTDDVTFVWQDEPKGTGHAIQQASDHVDGMFSVVLGDSIFSHPQYHARNIAHGSHTDGVIVTERVEQSKASEYATVHVNPSGIVERIIEKPESPTVPVVDTGWYYLPPEFMEVDIDPADDGEQRLQDGINQLAYDGKTFLTAQLAGDRVNVNGPSDIGRAETIL